jgi:hypothetical protein
LTDIPVADIESATMMYHTRRSWDTSDPDTDGMRRSYLPVVLALVGLVGALLILVALVHPSAGAAGGCGGG